MKRTACVAILLLSPGILFVVPAADAQSISGLWKVDGQVMGTPVRMMCALTETDHKLSGTCSGAEDGFAAHKVAGSVKAQKVEYYFQTAIGGNPITLIVSGTLNEDRSQMEGDLDVEPMAVGGPFAAVREPSSDAAATIETATPAASAASEATPPSPTFQPLATGTWKIDGDVQGTPVQLLCVLTEAEHRLTGTCTGADENKTPRALAGTATEKGLGWRFDAEYQGQPITVSISATLAADGARMNGTIAVAPMGAEGTFAAIKQ
jgi:hypothetical protein